MVQEAQTTPGLFSITYNAMDQRTQAINGSDNITEAYS